MPNHPLESKIVDATEMGRLINTRHGSRVGVVGMAAVEWRRAVGHAVLSATTLGGYLDHVAVLAR